MNISKTRRRELLPSQISILVNFHGPTKSLGVVSVDVVKISLEDLESLSNFSIMSIDLVMGLDESKEGHLIVRDGMAQCKSNA
jgi:hypothetical protein